MGSVAEYEEARHAARMASLALGRVAGHSVVAAGMLDARVRAAAMRADRVTVERALHAFYVALDAQVEALESALEGGE